jgi:hypothetical protein
MGEAGEDGERGLSIEQIIGIEVRHMFAALRIGRDFKICLDTKNLPRRNPNIRQTLKACAAISCCDQNEFSVLPHRNRRRRASVGGVRPAGRP